MIPATCKINVCAFVQKSGNPCEDSTFPKLTLSSDNKVTIFQDDISSKTFKFDKICSEDFQDTLESLANSVTKDVVESINRILFVYKFSGNDTTPIIDMMTLSSFMLKEIYAAVNSEENCDISLHVSCIEVNDLGIIDLIQKSDTTSNDIKVFELLNQAGSGFTERIITNARDIDEIMETIFQKNIPNASFACRHTIVISIIALKSRNIDGFEVMKTGRFILVDIEGCINFLKEAGNFIGNSRESFDLVRDASPVIKHSKLWNCSLSNILKNFLCTSKISVLLSLPATLFDMEYMNALDIISELQNIRLKPVINEKLIIRQSLEEYADEIKALEKDLLVLKNNNGILMSHQKYRSLKNRLLLNETQLKEVQKKGNALRNSVNNKKETLTKLQEEIKLKSIKIEEEMKKLKISKVTLEETEQKKIALNLKKMVEVDECVSMNNLIISFTHCMKNQKAHLMKVKYAWEKSSSRTKQLLEYINSYTINATEEQKKLKVKVETLLYQLKEILLYSTMHHNNFMLNTNEFHLKFEEMLNFWKQQSTGLIVDFHSFIKEVFHVCHSLKNNLCSELESLNCAEGAIFEVIKKNKVETLHTITSCSNKIHQFVENSIKLLYEVLCLLEISEGKIKEQLNKLESAMCCHSNERMNFFNCTKSTMVSLHHYFNVQLDISSKINSDIFIHHQEMKLSINQEIIKIKEALNSIKTLFSNEQKFGIDKWRQRQMYLFNVKEIDGVSESLQQCIEEHPTLLDKLRKQCVTSIDELYCIFKDQTLTVENLDSQSKKIFNEIQCSIKNCSEENKKLINQEENDIKDNLEIQNETVIKCINTSRSLIEDAIESITGGLQNIRNSFLNVKDLKKNNHANHIILDLRNKLNDYIKKYANILELSEFTFQELPETVPRQTENVEESVEFNHEELLSSTPSSYHERPKNLINDKMKFLKRLRKITIERQNNLSLDQERIMNTTILSRPSTSNRTKVHCGTSNLEKSHASKS